MAAYEKQQPQPHLNGAYYGPPIPPQPAQPAYYAPPPRGPRCLFCCLFKVIALVVIALGAASLVLWLVFRPGSVRASAASATLSRFDLVDGPGGGGGGGPRGLGGSGQLLQYNLTVDIRVLNPNRFGIHYDYAEAQASYDGERFGFDSVQPFYLDSNGERMITATFGGSSPVDEDDDDVQRTYRREKSNGFYFVKVRVKADVGFKVRVFNVRRKNRITCKLWLPVPSADSTPVTTQLGTRCAVDF